MPADRSDMTDGWLPASKYERIEICGCTGPGTMVDGYAWKFVGHTTESPMGALDGVISLFQAKPCYCPHFTIDPGGSQRRVQHIPWIWSAAALRPGQGGYETNRGRAIQAEICGYAQDSPGWSDDILYQIADLIADLIKDGCPINPTNVPDYVNMQGVLATENAPQRLSWPDWRRFDGIGAHVIVPGQDHWDWGRAHGEKISAFVQNILNGQNITVVPQPGHPPLPTPPSVPTVGYLQKGMTGGLIVHLQEQLQAAGYNVGPSGCDGVFGFATETAVRQFQAAHRLTVDGIVGPQTQAALDTAAGGTPAPPPPPQPSAGYPAWPGRFLVLQTPYLSGGDVQTWQNQMHTRGWPISVDGSYGPQSRDMCTRFQTEKGLVCDGVVGRQTWNATWTSPVT